MCDKVNLDEIRQIPAGEFKEIISAWMEQREVTKTLQKRMRKILVEDFQKTEIGKQLEAEKQKSLFNSKDFVVDTLQAEHLYNHNNHFTLSVFFTETRNSSVLPNFEKEEGFRFGKGEVQELVEMLGITRTDKITRRILNTYKSSSNSLLEVLLSELIKGQNQTETRSVATQTENPQQQQSLDLSVISTLSKKAKKKKKPHTLSTQEFKGRKQKKLKEVSVISQNLEKMSKNISVISSKLDEFHKNPKNDDSKSIISHIGTIMSTLNGCIGNFEHLCADIKQINETRNKNYAEWMDDLQNSDNGRRFLKKLQKSFSRVMNEEKLKLQKEFRRKFDREKSKLASRQRASSKKSEDLPVAITKEINEIFENTCLMIKNVEKEEKLMKKPPIQAPHSLNDCQQIHSDASSSIKSDPNYGSTSFEDDKSDENN